MAERPASAIAAGSESYAEQLHGDAIVIGKSKDPNKVIIEPFIGIAPLRHKELFEGARRKNYSGDFEQWKDKKPQPIIKYTIATYASNETAIATEQRNRSC